MKKPVCSVVGVSILAAGMLVSTATAATITQTQPFSGVPDYTQVLTFNQFDDLGGTLTLLSVYVEVNLNAIGGALRCDNDAPQSASGAIEFGAQAAITASVPLIDAMFQPIFQPGDVKATGGTTLNLTADDDDLEVGGTPNFSMMGTDYGFYLGGSVWDSDSGIVNSLVYGSYIGTGTFTITVEGTQVANYGSLGGVQAQIDPLDTTGTVTVIYNYIPEPATLGLLLLGGLLTARRRIAA